MAGAPSPVLSTVVVHWHNEDHLRELIEAWPDDPRCELLVVDNSSSLDALPKGACRLDSGRNLGFGGGANYGVRAARGTWVLILNPDVRPEAGAVGALLASLQGWDPEATPAGLVPALVDGRGKAQTPWQLRPLPSVLDLLLHTFFLPGAQGPAREPERGTPIPQPAGAAIVVRRSVLEGIGGFDEGYFPAWFEDVDLARRLDRAGHRLLYEPRARFRHAIGGSLPALGYGPFLWIYYRNLTRYLKLHHGRFPTLAARLALPIGMLLRLAFLPFRRPRRCRTRREAAAGLLAVAAGSLTSWRRPRRYNERFARPEVP